MAPEEFPPIRSFEGVEPLVLPGKMLKNMFSKTSFAICTDQARHNLTGLLIEISNGVMTAVATDGRRMSLYREEEGIAEGIEIKVIIPGKLIHELERLLDDEKDIEVFIGENQAAFSFYSIRLVTALIEGTFPNYEMVIPKNHDKEALIDTDQFLEAMRRTCTMTNEKFNSVRISISNGMMSLKVVTPEVGEYEEELSIQYDGDPVEIAFNPEFVLEVLRHIDPDMTSLVLKDAMSPGIIKPHHDAPRDNYVNVVMPIRI
jgi:DNA polymerase-3 subunit beta